MKIIKSFTLSTLSPEQLEFEWIMTNDSLNNAGELSVPCSTCGTPCILRTANTANNRGRKFYSCQSQECNFFVYVTLFTMNLVIFLSISMSRHGPYLNSFISSAVFQWFKYIQQFAWFFKFLQHHPHPPPPPPPKKKGKVCFHIVYAFGGSWHDFNN